MSQIWLPAGGENSPISWTKPTFTASAAGDKVLRLIGYLKNITSDMDADVVLVLNPKLEARCPN